MVLMGDTAIQMFYRRLFSVDATAHDLFSQTDMSAQRIKFMDTFSTLVQNIGDLEASIPMLEELGRLHARYGVQDHHYDSVREALLLTIESLGQVLDDSARGAWDAAYARITDPMRKAGY